MKKKTVIFSVVVLVVHVLFFSIVNADDLVDKTRVQIKKIIETSGKKFTCHGEMICGVSVLPQFYERRDYKPAWSDQEGLLPRAKTLMDVIHEAPHEGLRT